MYAAFVENFRRTVQHRRRARSIMRRVDGRLNAFDAGIAIRFRKMLLARKVGMSTMFSVGRSMESLLGRIRCSPRAASQCVEIAPNFLSSEIESIAGTRYGVAIENHHME